jgi:acyl-CoA synthetase (AMP-forming)/AMP-acid ligase II
MTVLMPADQLRKPASVGKPFTNVEIKIVGPDSATLPSGEIGEICCDNPSVMTCYAGMPEATALAFTGRWLHTGDLGYLDGEGFLHIVGRRTDMIISGGVNIYPVEIESVLNEHPAVLDSAVVGVPDLKWGQAIKAYISLRGDYRPTLQELQRHCAACLADYKKPRHLEIVDEIPRNVGGKIVKPALQPPAGASVA